MLKLKKNYNFSITAYSHNSLILLQPLLIYSVMLKIACHITEKLKAQNIFSAEIHCKYNEVIFSVFFSLTKPSVSGIVVAAFFKIPH